MATKIATELVEGDIVHYNGQTSWKLGPKLKETEKTITFRIEIIRSDWSPQAVGRPGTWRFRRGTEVCVDGVSTDA
jgi:hypothetical protein